MKTRTIRLAQIGLVTAMALGGATVQYTRPSSSVPVSSPFLVQAGGSATLYDRVQATCGACHNNAHFVTAGDFHLDNTADAKAGGIVAHTRGIDPTQLYGSTDPATALIIQKPLKGSITPHGGIKLDASNPTIQALMAWVAAGAPGNPLDPPAPSPATPQYRTAVIGANHHEILYARRTYRRGGFRDLVGSKAGGDIYRLVFDNSNTVISNTTLIPGGLPATDDAQNPSVSLDGTKVVFARKQPGTPWKIWECGIDGSNLRQITTGSGDDIQPWYLPWIADPADPTTADPARDGSGGIGFVSNRAGFHDEYEASLSLNLYVCDTNGSNVRQIEFNPSHDVHPFLHSSGVTLFTRWEHNEHQGHNFMPLFSICAADYLEGGTNLFGAFGEHNTGPGNSLHEPSEDWTYSALNPNGGTSGWVIARGSMRDDGGGSIVGPFYPKLQTPHPAPNVILQGDFDTMKGEMNPEVDITSVTYRSPRSLLNVGVDHEYVVCVATLVSTSQQFQDFNGSTTTKRVYGNFSLRTFVMDPVTLKAVGSTTTVLLDWQDGISFEDPTPVIVRPTPPRIGKQIDETQAYGTFTSGDVRERQSDGQPTNIDLTKVSGIRFIRALQFSQGSVNTGRKTDQGIATQILGDVPVQDDGSWAANVPANVPIQFELLDKDNRVIVAHKPWVQVTGGETMRCVGCHADHSQAAKVQTLKARQGDPITLNLANVQQFNFEKDIQPIFNEKCVRCHDYALKGGAAGNLSLVGRPVPGGTTESFQELVGKNYVHTQAPNASPLMWTLTGKKLDDNPPTAYPPNDIIPHSQMATAAEIDELDKWISAGINFRVVSDNFVDPLKSLDENTFTTKIWPIIQDRCLSCHTTGGAGGLAMDLSGDPQNAESEEQVIGNRIMAVSRRVNFMVPQASIFLRKPLGETLGGLSHVGGQMFTGFDDPEYKTIFNWIASANPALNAALVPPTDLVNVENFPNPFRDSTIFVYHITGSAAASITVRIYSQNGKMIKELPGPADISTTTMGWNRVEWDGTDKNGKTVGNDVYFYTVDARFNDGKTKLIRGKCVKAK